MPAQLIDSEEKLRDLLTKVQHQTQEQRLMFLDLEGVDLSRHGTLAIVQVLMPPDPTVYLIDVTILGSKAFTTSIDDASMLSLQSILESGSVVKVVFDIRNDCNALFFQFGANLRGIVDLQLLEYVTRQQRSRLVNGLSKCVDREETRLPAYIRGWKIQKEDGHRLFNPERGGDFKVFLQRPLSQAIINYCEKDALVMPALLEIYSKRLEPHLSAQLQDLVDSRIALAQSEEFEVKGTHMAEGPQLRARRNVYDPDVGFPMSVMSSLSVTELCHITYQPEPKNFNPATHVKQEARPEPEPTPKATLTPTNPLTMETISSQVEHIKLETKSSECDLASGSSSKQLDCNPGPEAKDEGDEVEKFCRGKEAELTVNHEDETSDFSFDGYNRYYPSYNYDRWDSEDEFKDLTACDKECGYCGRCPY